MFCFFLMSLRPPISTRTDAPFPYTTRFRSEGPSTVLRVTPEDPSLRSVVCLGRTTTILPISRAYDAFVRAPSGIVERAVGHPAFRVDVSAPIDDGDSWQLGLYLAHRLKVAGRLAEDGAPAG